MCVFVAPKENYFTFIRYLCACGANWHSRATVRARARVRVKKTCITAAVRQLLFRVKTERNLKLLKKLLVERKATLHSKCISRTRHADAHVLVKLQIWPKLCSDKAMLPILLGNETFVVHRFED